MGAIRSTSLSGVWTPLSGRIYVRRLSFLFKEGIWQGRVATRPQVLVAKLAELKYKTWATVCSMTNKLHDLFFEPVLDIM